MTLLFQAGDNSSSQDQSLIPQNFKTACRNLKKWPTVLNMIQHWCCRKYKDMEWPLLHLIVQERQRKREREKEAKLKKKISDLSEFLLSTLKVKYFLLNEPVLWLVYSHELPIDIYVCGKWRVNIENNWYLSNE